MRLTRTAISTRLAKLERETSGDEGAAFVTLRAFSPEGEAALIAEGKRRGEIDDRDTIVTIRNFGNSWATFEPSRRAGGKSRPILVGFAEPPGTPWLESADRSDTPGAITYMTSVTAAEYVEAPARPVARPDVEAKRDASTPDAPVDSDARDALRAELARLKAAMAAAQEAEAEREAEKAAVHRPVGAFRRVTAADRSPVMNLGKPQPH